MQKNYLIFLGALILTLPMDLIAPPKKIAVDGAAAAAAEAEAETEIGAETRASSRSRGRSRTRKEKARARAESKYKARASARRRARAQVSADNRSRARIRAQANAETIAQARAGADARAGAGAGSRSPRSASPTLLTQLEIEIDECNIKVDELNKKIRPIEKRIINIQKTLNNLASRSKVKNNHEVSQIKINYSFLNKELLELNTERETIYQEITFLENRRNELCDRSRRAYDKARMLTETLLDTTTHESNSTPMYHQALIDSNSTYYTTAPSFRILPCDKALLLNVNNEVIAKSLLELAHHNDGVHYGRYLGDRGDSLCQFYKKVAGRSDSRIFYTYDSTNNTIYIHFAGPKAEAEKHKKTFARSHLSCSP
ncbi:hypothetical protein FJ366_02780 [Candidatus Dependentiae bacterium]|nr:hypothetical protein [Candidatus Dependentiae bacterium]